MSAVHSAWYVLFQNDLMAKMVSSPTSTTSAVAVAALKPFAKTFIIRVKKEMI